MVINMQWKEVSVCLSVQRCLKSISYNSYCDGDYFMRSQSMKNLGLDSLYLIEETWLNCRKPDKQMQDCPASLMALTGVKRVQLQLLISRARSKVDATGTTSVRSHLSLHGADGGQSCRSRADGVWLSKSIGSAELHSTSIFIVFSKA